MGPAALRMAGLVSRLEAAGVDAFDAGDVVVPPSPGSGIDPRKRHIEAIAVATAAVFDRTREALNAGRFPVLLGGDHTVAAGSAGATATHVREQSGGRIGVLWIDAHGDLNTPATTLSGNVHGMPLAALLGDEPVELAGLGGWTRKILPAHTVLVGTRSLDEAERQAITRRGIHVYTADDVRRRGVAEVMAEVRGIFAATDGVHVSLDIDVCDPDDAPGVSTPEPGGVSLADVRAILREVAALDMRSFDLVEVNPAQDVRNRTAELAVDLALSVLAPERRAS